MRGIPVPESMRVGNCSDLALNFLIPVGMLFGGDRTYRRRWYTRTAHFSDGELRRPMRHLLLGDCSTGDRSCSRELGGRRRLELSLLAVDC